MHKQSKKTDKSIENQFCISVVDFSYIFSEGSDEHFMYSSDLVDAATITSTKHNFLVTIGLRY